MGVVVTGVTGLRDPRCGDAPSGTRDLGLPRGGGGIVALKQDIPASFRLLLIVLHQLDLCL